MLVRVKGADGKRHWEKILNEENPNPRVTKKEVRVSLGKFKHSPKTA